MTDKQIQDIADRVIDALHQLAPREPSFWAVFLTVLAALGPLIALFAAFLVYRSARKTLKQRQRADDRAEWWRRAQWALESAASKDEKLNAAGTKMIPLMNTSDLLDEADRDLLDTIWQADPAARDEQSAEEFERRLDEFDEEQSLDDIPDTGENGITQEESQDA